MWRAKPVSVGRRAPIGVVVGVVGLVCLLVCGSALAVGDANRSQCATELEGFPGITTEVTPGFRSFMPDCRAYELVTPPYIAGEVPFGQGDFAKLPQISPNGEHVLSIDYAGFAGAENDEQSGLEYGATYEYSRTPAGWNTEALEPPASQYPRRNFLMPSANLERSLWEVFVPAHENEELPPYIAHNSGFFAIREPAGDGKGRFTVVGPSTAPGHEPETEENSSPTATVAVGGASDNLQHIFFEVQAVDRQLWPGDETESGEWSLYEYAAGRVVEPVLVAVKNHGTLHGREHVNEDAELISKCGAELGSVKVATSFNAVSETGNVVYFTARECPSGPVVDELYARVNGQETVAISEPPTGPGGECETCEETVREPAVFEGASEDGLQVFFLSEQKMFGGTEGEAEGEPGENLYEYNFEATNPHERLSFVAPHVTAVTNPTEDGSRVYFQSPYQLTLTPNSNGEHAAETTETEAHNNLYVYETADRRTHTAEKRIAYVAQEPGPIDTTHDGQFAVFESPMQLTGTDDTSAVPQLFEYDAYTGTVTRVSIGQASSAGFMCATTGVIEPNYNCDGNTADDPPVMVPPTASAATFPSPNRTSEISVAADGMVVFESGDALTPFSVPGGENLYEYRENNVYLIAAGEEAVSVQDNEASRLYGTDESGNDVFFRSTLSLVPQDTDTQASFYDARTGGGFPGRAVSSGCSGVTCRGATSGAPSPPAVLSDGVVGSTPSTISAAPSAGATAKRTTAAQARAKKLARALKACRKKPRKRARRSCESEARRKFASAAKATTRKGG